MAPQAEDAYCTLVMSDSYLPGAAVLAHSLRDGGATKKLAALITLDTLSADSISELKELYDYVIPVPHIGNPKPANLYLMDRGDLAYTFTKIALWRQLQFRKIVYIDADVVALRAPNELFDLEASFAAAPDSGWPDCFNSGVMVVSPNMGDYWALQTLAASGDSFDGADQGLFNQYYEHKSWHRLSFLYNCTPNAQYQWEPAFRHYKSKISLVHFIGKNKPWSKDSRYGGGSGVYSELSARWWAVYDRHLREKAEHVDAETVLQTAPNTIQQAGWANGQSTTPASQGGVASLTQPAVQPTHPAQHSEHSSPPRQESGGRFSPPHMEWDATRTAPPVESRPEAANFPTQTYTFSEDHHLFKAPAAYPEPPKNMWYEVPEAKPAPQVMPKAIFPWEQERERPKPTRVFAEDLAPPQPAPQPVADPTASSAGVPATLSSEGDDATSKGSPLSATPKTPEDPWQTFGQTSANAWDSVPGIEKYVRAVMGAQMKKSKPAGISLEGLVKPIELFSPTGEGTSERRESLILTDFPSAFERPSLPVTPAPVRRPTFWGNERDETGELPAAEGVPSQAEWNPEERLETLRRSSLLELEHLRRASASNAPSRELPAHSVPRPHNDAQHHSLLGRASPQAQDKASKDNGQGQASQAHETKTETATALKAEDVKSTAETTKPVFSEPDFGNPPAVEDAESSGKKADVKADILSPTERS
ncbi:glycosyltransferase family 8 protein [Diplodia corticola]|uniref:glycogenin glucosyltransferase n=1 Tax=Diplodia corticola TaxID=236234 RepID=A0A1J9S9P9_9PEZI|nr:glycosyltransferase family 8 protein [Diplodia corticola]OJD36309.1 glycosyltransferase family 8 protein [Diplodia corticola]